jgi:hypothetical protein
MNRSNGLDETVARVVTRFREKAKEQQFDMPFTPHELLQVWTRVERHRRKYPNLKTKDICLEIAAQGGIECLWLSDGVLEVKPVREAATIRNLHREGRHSIESREPLAKALADLMRRNTGMAEAWRTSQDRLPPGAER